MARKIIVFCILGVILLSVPPLAVSKTLISDVRWDPAKPTTNDKIRVYARVTDPSGIKLVQLFHMQLRHFSPVGHMTRHEDDIWILDIGPYDRNSIDIRLVAQNGKGESSVSDVYTISFGKYRAIIRRYLPWVILFFAIIVFFLVYRRLKHPRGK